ncbi:MAG: hypothetical protein WBG46_00865 [Nonlabens sp.]
MKIKFLITLVSVVALTFLGVQNDDTPRAQEIVYETSALNSGFESASATAAIESVLIDLGAEDVAVEIKRVHAGFKISFSSSYDPQFIKEQIGKVLKKSVSNNYSHLTDDVAVSYKDSTDGASGSGCHGIIVKDIYQDHFRLNSLDKWVVGFSSLSYEHRYQSQVKTASFFLESHLLFSTYSFVPDSRAGPLNV